MDPLIEKLTFKEIAKLLKSSYLEEFMQSQVETKALQELKHCYESLSSGKGYWEMESENLNNLEDLLETIIITVRRHGHQLNLMKFKDSDL